MIYGDGKDKTIIVGSRNFMDGTPTFETATFGNHFTYNFFLSLFSAFFLSPVTLFLMQCLKRFRMILIFYWEFGLIILPSILWHDFLFSVCIIRLMENENKLIGIATINLSDQ